MSGRNSQMTRVFRILNLLETHKYGLSVAEITTKLENRGVEISKRTVYRDLEAIMAAGFPLSEKGKTDDQGTKWVLETQSHLGQPLTLTFSELWSLYFARNALKNLENTPFYENLESTFTKIEEKLGSKAQEYLNEVSAEIKFDEGPKLGSSISDEIIGTIKAGCGEKQLLNIEYASAHSQTKKIRKVGPLFIYFSKGAFYLVARDLDGNCNKTFSLSRISSAELLDEPYEGDDVDPSEYFAHSFGIFRGEEAETVRLSFCQRIAPYIKERIWHKSQSVDERDDGSIALTMKVAITPELIQWVLSYSSDCRVIEPESLQEKIMSLSREIIAMYGRNAA